MQHRGRKEDGINEPAIYRIPWCLCVAVLRHYDKGMTAYVQEQNSYVPGNTSRGNVSFMKL